MAAFGKKRGQARAPEVKFAQHLAANEKKVRDKAVKKLRQWLEARSQAKGGFEEDDMLKIWKGLFYCMWMSDKPLVQEELAKTMSNLLHCLKNEDTVFLFIKVFFKTMIREWNGIDHLRMDKFFMLIRNMVSQCLEFLRRNQWEARLTDRFMNIMKEGPMSTSTEEVPNGIRYHICDLWVEELEAVGGKELSPQELLPFLTPYFMLLKKSDNMTFLQSIGTSVLDEIISRADFTVPAKLQEEDDDEKDEQEKTRSDDDDEEEEEGDEPKGEDDDEEEEKATLRFDHAAIADQLFMLASEKDTRNKNRRLMYNWVKKFKDAASGIYPDQNLLQLLDSESDEDESEHQKRKAQKKDPGVPIILREDEHVEDVKKRKKKRKKQSQRAKKAEQPGEGKDLEMNCMNAVGEVDVEQMGGEEKGAENNVEQTLDKEHTTNGDATCDSEVSTKSVKRKKKTKGKDKTTSQGEALVESADAKLSEHTKKKKEVAKAGTKSKVKPKKRSAFEAYLDDSKEEAVESVAKVDESCVEVVVLPGPEDDVADEPLEGKEPVKKKVLTEAQSSIQSPAPQTKQSPKVKRKKKRYFEGVTEDSDNKEESINESSNLNSGKKQKRKSSSTPQLADGLDESPSSSPVSPKKKKKNKQKEVFASFEKFAVSPPSFFRKAASKAMPRSEPKLKKTPKKSSSNGLPIPSSEPIDGKKRVAFALSKNTTQEFRKNEKSLAVSPAPVAIPYDSSRQPEQGVLKPSSATPPVGRKAKRRAMAADFF
ncbi:RRP1B [Branchiostoma lanceolatum]|uniref:RRP1B protein n=1 Tax=Branchiostoma lanceolatum TaxID=7740 RepID=A0A8K0ETQ1_BRALA|nr:RRP1B [Branchiostoma lanceolatum]